MIKDNIRKVLGNVNFFDGSVGVSKELLRQLNLRKIDYTDDKLKIEFIDSSEISAKEERFNLYVYLLTCNAFFDIVYLDFR